MALFDILTERGFVHDATPRLRERLARGPVTAYVGFDPTADSLHCGNLVPVMGLAWLQRLGGTPIVLVGGGTGLVGDPSGKRQERPMLDEAAVAANAAAIGRQLRRFLRFEGPHAARLVDNADWLRDLTLMRFLRDTGKHFTVNYMLQKDSVKSRMETGISYTEFSYMLIQAHDFLHLFRAMACELQMGGSDQWGNITAGIELIARVEGAEAHGLVFPLLTTASGAKFGKSEQGNVWLDAERTSPYRFHQFWLNTDDRDVERFLRLFTFLDAVAIAGVMAAQAADPGARPAQRRLAHEVTTLVHGAEATAQAEAAARALFSGSPDESPEALAAMPVARVSLPADGIPVVEALVAAGLAASKGEARRGVSQRGYYLNGAPIDTVARRIVASDAQAGDEPYVILRKGKKTYVRLVLAGAA